MVMNKVLATVLSVPQRVVSAIPIIGPKIKARDTSTETTTATPVKSADHVLTISLKQVTDLLTGYDREKVAVLLDEIAAKLTDGIHFVVRIDLGEGFLMETNGYTCLLNQQASPIASTLLASSRTLSEKVGRQVTVNRAVKNRHYQIICSV